MNIDIVDKHKRDSRLDVIRGLAMLFIIAGHTISYYAFARSFIYSFHVPLFFFLSGYLFRVKSGKLKSTVSRLMKPYGVTAAALAILMTIKQLVNAGGVSAANELLEWLKAAVFMSGRRTDFGCLEIVPIGAIWFLPAMVWATVALWCILKYIPDSLIGQILRLLVVGILFAFGYGTAKIIWLPFSIQSGLTALIFMYAGYFTKNYLQTRNILDTIWKKTLAFIVAAALWAVDWYVGLRESMSIVEASYPNILLNIVGALAAIYIIYTLVEHTINVPILNPIYKYLGWFGKNTMAILCFHLIEMDLIPFQSIFESLVPWFPTVILILLVRVLWATLWAFISSKNKILKAVF